MEIGKYRQIYRLRVWVGFFWRRLLRSLWAQDLDQLRLILFTSRGNPITRAKPADGIRADHILIQAAWLAGTHLHNFRPVKRDLANLVNIWLFLTSFVSHRRAPCSYQAVLIVDYPGRPYYDRFFSNVLIPQSRISPWSARTNYSPDWMHTCTINQPFIISSHNNHITRAKAANGSCNSDA